jgi:hypothetical protein
MERREHDESWTIPFEIAIWTTLVCGVVAVLVVVLMTP